MQASGGADIEGYRAAQVEGLRLVVGAAAMHEMADFRFSSADLNRFQLS
jgi:hypothetical protein